MNRKDFIERLFGLSAKYRIEIQEDTAGKLYLYYTELFAWNQKINLISRNEEPRFIERHIIDSLLALNSLDIKETDRLLDLGSGNGLPGIPIALVLPENKVDLLEPNSKKCVFLKHIKFRLRMQNVSVICKRLERIGPGQSKYEYVFVRGLKVSEKRLEEIQKRLDKKGNLVFYCGKKSDLPLSLNILGTRIHKGFEDREIIIVSQS